MTRPDKSTQPHATDISEPDISSTEIDMDDMTGEIARTLLACEELTSPSMDTSAEASEEPSWGGMAGWFK